MIADKQPPRDTWREAIENSKRRVRKMPTREAESHG